ncbi:hypothetical protein JCM6882_008050 [Rhodosporidiobolus microsporus]
MSFDSASSSSSPVAAWVDASSSPYSSPEASTSTSSLWTVSSTSGRSDRRSSVGGAQSDAESAQLVPSSSSEDDSNDDEQSCLALLEQLERERTRVAARVRTGTSRQSVAKRDSRDVQRMQEDVFGGYALQSSPVGASPVAGPSTYQQTRRPQVFNAPKGILPSSSLVSMNSMSTIRPSASSASLKRASRGRRLSFTRTDIADLDIDAILDAYAHDVPFEEPAPRPSSRASRAPPAPSTPSRNSLPRSKSTANLRNIRHDIFPAPPVPSPASIRTFNGHHGAKMPPLERSTTRDSARSIKSTKSTASNAYDELFPHRRVAPFPTMPRMKSSTSLRSMARGSSSSSGFDSSQAPPMPPLPLPLPPTPRSTRSTGNRTFSSFARQSTCSTTSSSSSFMSSPPHHHSQPQYPFLRTSYQSSSHYTPSLASSSRASSAFSSSLSDGSSVRWSVATSSTAPSSAAFSDAGGDNCSRRGSVLFASPVLGAPASPARRGSAPRFRLADEPTEEMDEEEMDFDTFAAAVAADDAQSDRLSSYPMSRRGTVESAVSAPSQSDDEDAKDTGGLISWEDFASELEALAPPPLKASQPQVNTKSAPFAPSAAPFGQARPRFDSAASSPFPGAGQAKRPSMDRARTGSNISVASTPAAAGSGRAALLRGKLSLATLRVR